MNVPTRILALAAMAATMVMPAVAQTTETKPATPPQTQGQTAPPARKPGEPKPYADVVTKEAVTQAGVFKVHRIDEKILWEIPTQLLGREMLWQTELAALGQNSGYPGTSLGTFVVRFSRRNNKVFMHRVEYGMRGTGDAGTILGVTLNSVEPILASFDVQAEGENKSSMVIDVTSMFMSDPPGVGLAGALGGGIDPARSYIDRVKAFPQNIESRVFVTIGGPRGGGATSALVHYSLVALPEKPMLPRLKDSRIGFFTTGFTEYGRPENRAIRREYINRFRLEKKDPNAALSEPVTPITFYLAREVPTKWRPWLKKGVEDWNVAFEAAGFKNAIRCLDAPTVEQDPTWDPEDARYSVIRWAPSPIANAMGPSIQDPRTGETISAHVIFWNNITDLLETWYFSQTAAIDKRAQSLPMPEELMGELVRYVSAHEVGHTLGLEHNFKASAWYSAAQLRDPKFTAENGVSASIMDYSRFNYVAQPGDGVTQTIGKVGPYDLFAIEYGYKPLGFAKGPDDEKRTLDAFLAKQVTDPRLRFGNYKWSQDSSVQTEDIGSDAIEASTYGLKNIDLIATKYLFNATTKFGEDYSRLATLRSELLGQRQLELFHVARNVGGVIETDYHAGRGGDVFKPVPKEKQAAAVKFLMTKGMEKPAGLYEPRLLNKLRPDGHLDEATSIPRTLMTTLLSENRIRRMTDIENQNPGNAFTVAQMVKDMTDHVWSELGQSAPTIDVYRRQLQRSYLRTIDGRINGSGATQTDLKPLAKDELKALAKKIDGAIAKSTDRLTKLHLQESRKDIENIINNKFASSTGGGGNPLGFLFGFDEDHANHKGCWSHGARIPAELQELLKKD